MWRQMRVLMALVIATAAAFLVTGVATAAASVPTGTDRHGGWGSGSTGSHPTVTNQNRPAPPPAPRPYCPPPTRPVYRPPVTKPVFRPPATRPPVTRPPVTRPPVTHPATTPPTTKPSGAHTAGNPPTTKPPTRPTTTTTTTTVPAPVVAQDATGGALRLDSFDAFQTFVKGVEASARRSAARSAVASRVAPVDASANLGNVAAPVVVPAVPTPDLLPQGPLFNDTPAPLLPLGASGLRSARSFVLLFGLSAVALGFLAFRARMARRHAMFGTATLDERGDYIDFV